MVPDVAEELTSVRRLRGTARAAVAARLHQEQDRLTALRSRPAIARPLVEVTRREDDVATLLGRARRSLRDRLGRAETDVAHARARVAALSPAATLARGYAVVRHGDVVVRSSAQVAAGTTLTVQLAVGSLGVTVDETSAPPEHPKDAP